MGLRFTAVSTGSNSTTTAWGYMLKNQNAPGQEFMAVSVKKKKPFVFPGPSNSKMCLQDLNMASVQVSWPVPMRAIGAQNLLTMPGGVSQSGYLHKKGGSQFSLMKWPLRFVILHKGCIYYFKSSTSPTPQGAFSLNGYNRVMRAAEETTSHNVFPFKIVHFSKRHRTWYFSASCEDERKQWMLGLRKEINYYHDRQDPQFPSDTDPDGFYGSVERPLEISYSPENAEDDYPDEDEEDEDEDYLKPDESDAHTGRILGPPPAYPPPPVPYQPSKVRPSAPLLPPLPNKDPPVPMQRDQPHPITTQKPNKGPPPPIPFAPHLQKPVPETWPRMSKNSVPPIPPQVIAKKQSSSTVTNWGQDPKLIGGMALPAPHTLPLCGKVEKLMNLGSLAKDSPPLRKQMPDVHRPPLLPKVPPEPKPKPKGTPLQRSSPDGQSFRCLLDEVPPHLGRQPRKETNDSDEDYENVQLPDSVFVDTTETSSVEKLFKDTEKSPQDGLYCIRNSGTKTSKVLVVWDVSLKKARNYRLFEENSKIFLETEVTFPTLAALVEYYYRHPLPNHSSLCLQKPYGYTPPR